MIHYILNIPNDIFQQHLLQYLDIPEIQNLDKSLQINNLYIRFIHKLLNTILISSNLSTITNNHILWLNKRKIKLMHIKFDINIKCDNQSILNIMQLCNSSITSICYKNKNELFMSEPYIHIIYKELETSIMKHALIKNNSFIKDIYSINLSGTNINDEFIIHLSKNCKQLILLNISNCMEIRNNTSIIELLRSSCYELVSLHAKNCIINDECIMTLANHCKNLKLLDITNCIDITDISINVFINNTIKLKSLNMHGCFNISTNAIIKLLQNNCELEILDTKYCKNITNECIITLTNHCKQLKYLDICNCLNISESSILYLVEHCKDLNVLNLSNIHSLNDYLIIHITKCCKQLQSLILYNSIEYLNITNESIFNGIGMYCLLLKELDLSNCRNINNEGIIYLSLKCKYLEILILKSCIYVSDQSIKEVSKNCLYIQLLNLQCCYDITDISIYELANNSKYLQSLSLYPKHSTSITDESILYLTKHCKQLIELELINCNISYNAINYIQRNCIHIKILNIYKNNFNTL